MAADFDTTMDLLDAAEQRQRDDAKRTVEANRTPAAPAAEQAAGARWLAGKLQATTSRWTTFKA